MIRLRLISAKLTDKWIDFLCSFLFSGIFHRRLFSATPGRRS